MLDEAEELLDEGGFTAIKLRLGYPTLEEDLAAVHAVRKRVPPATIVMTDYNQALTVSEALERGRALDREGLAWIEEPIRHDDYRGNAGADPRARRRPFRSERTSTAPMPWPMRSAAQACDYAMPDFARIGGVSGWLDCGLARAGRAA